MIKTAYIICCFILLCLCVISSFVRFICGSTGHDWEHLEHDTTDLKNGDVIVSDVFQCKKCKIKKHSNYIKSSNNKANTKNNKR